MLFAVAKLNLNRPYYLTLKNRLAEWFLGGRFNLQCVGLIFTENRYSKNNKRRTNLPGMIKHCLRFSSF